MFVIKCTKGNNYGMYVGEDSISSNFPCWVDFLSQAIHFDSVEDARDYMDSPGFKEPRKYSHEEIPPRMIYAASGVIQPDEKKEYEISIVEIKEIVIETPLSGIAEIKKL